MFEWKGYAEEVRIESIEYSDDAHLQSFATLYFEGRSSAEKIDAENFLYKELRSGTRRLLVYGRPGSGKSFLLRKLAYRLADELIVDIDNANHGQVPSESVFIPIIVRLNRFDLTDRKNADAPNALLSFIHELLNSALNVEFSLDDLFNSERQFVIIMDDLDEISTSNLQDNLSDIAYGIEHLSGFRSVRIVIAGRESVTNRFRHRFRPLKIENLSLGSVKILFQQLVVPNVESSTMRGINVLEKSELMALDQADDINDIDKGERLLEYISKPEGLLEFLSTPYFAIKTAQFWNDPGNKDFNLGRLLFSILSNFIFRQEKREEIGFDEDILYERAELLERIAVDCMLTNSPLSKQHRTEARNSLEWYKSMEFIDLNPIAPTFTNKWIHGFFAAHYVTRGDIFSESQRYDFLEANIAPFSPLKAAFLQLLQDLIGLDYNQLIPKEVDLEQQFTESEKEWYSWGFEQKVRAYYEEQLGFKVKTSFRPPFLNNREIDIYAEVEKGDRTIIETVECKFRFPPYPKSAQVDYLNQLYTTWEEVNREMHNTLERQGRSVKVTPTLITNGGEYPTEFVEQARQRKIRIYHVDLPLNKHTARSKLNKQQVQLIEQGNTVTVSKRR